ncbi:ABC transporter permease [Nonomuraea sp. NEAU-A123]|uniref:ABC transporter permease n=1 Tax=Nonomuraea sp. NEAU-A123 TaxID=2839649 RepID=UPI001BE43488|nr:ABC transporter permease [Nonomuraea sp. NEAU-A123]MBT2230218.1 ABC transporter permease [Nonomuraea sp. NEAU-A123]
MIWLAWRQFRGQAMAVYGLLAVLVVILVITGPPLPGSGVARLTSAEDKVYNAGIMLVYGLPAIIGIFWGAPLVTRELEAGTYRLAWNQTVTRTRWLATKLALTGLAAATAAGLLSLAVTWWAGSIDAASQPSTLAHVVSVTGADAFASRVSPPVFGARGIVPVGYAVFAFVLGVAAGILLRRTVLAMAVTLAVFVAVQVAVLFAVRPYVIPAAQDTIPITSANISKLGVSGSGGVAELAVAGPRGAWVLAAETVDAAGQAVTAPPWTATCVMPPRQVSETHPVPSQECFAKLSALGYRQLVTYQPASRFWALQGIETAIFLTLSALLTWLCIRWTRTRLP